PAARGRSWRGPALTALTAAVLFAPHAIWVVRHDFITLRYAVNRAEGESRFIEHLINPLEFVAAQGIALLPLFICATAVLGWRWPTRQINPNDRVTRDYLLAVVLGPFALHLALSLVFGLNLRSMWGAPLWTFAGLALL